MSQQSWEEGLRAVEHAMGLMPKSLQRDLVHYKLIFKSRLGRSVESDMIKFQVSQWNVKIVLYENTHT